MRSHTQVLVPYLKAKLDNYHKALQEQSLSLAAPRDSATRDDSSSSTSMVSAARARMSVFMRRLKQLQLVLRLKRAFRTSYPFAHFAYEGAFFLYQVRPLAASHFFAVSSPIGCESSRHHLVPLMHAIDCSGSTSLATRRTSRRSCAA